MPCYACSAEFGLLRKEIGCSVCGFSFCGKCCKKREVPIETGEFKKLIICVQCVNKKPSNKSAADNVSPPLAHKKRMEAFKKQSASVDSASHVLLQSEWSDDKDKAIAERLQKLKRDRIKDLPSEGEIEERIAKLKGMDPSKYKAPPIEVFRPADRRTSLEKATDLMKQYEEEVDIESKIVKPEDEIAARLAKLRADDSKNDQDSIPQCKDVEDMSQDTSDQDTDDKNIKGDDVESLIKKAKLAVASSVTTSEDVDMSEEEEAEKLVEKFMAAKFDDMENLDSLNDQDSDKSLEDQNSPTEEFPWCTICSEDAKIRCFECSGDLYCLRCFRECHDSLDIKDHRTCPFLAPKNPVL